MRVGVGPGIPTFHRAEGRCGHWQDFPLIVVDYHEIPSATRAAGLIDVKKPQRRRVIELKKVPGPVPCFSQTESQTCGQ